VVSDIKVGTESRKPSASPYHHTIPVCTNLNKLNTWALFVPLVLGNSDRDGDWLVPGDVAVDGAKNGAIFALVFAPGDGNCVGLVPSSLAFDGAKADDAVSLLFVTDVECGVRVAKDDDTPVGKGDGLRGLERDKSAKV
jgi:hypothetical protein